MGLAPGALARYLFRPGGLLDAIPTKTPVFPHQFLVSCTSSFRQFFHVFRTIFGLMALALKILVFVRMLSIFSLTFMACSHLLCISLWEWNFSGSLFQVIALLHLIFHIGYMDSDMMILNNLFMPSSALPLPFLKVERQQPISKL